MTCAVTVWLTLFAPPVAATPSLRIAQADGSNLGLVAGWTPTRDVWLHYGKMASNGWLLRARNGLHGTWGIWHSYDAATLAFSWRLSAGDGEKAVYLQYQRQSDATRHEIRRTIILDTVHPRFVARSVRVLLYKLSSGAYALKYRFSAADNRGAWDWESYTQVYLNDTLFDQLDSHTDIQFGRNFRVVQEAETIIPDAPGAWTVYLHIIIRDRARNATELIASRRLRL